MRTRNFLTTERPLETTLAKPRLEPARCFRRLPLLRETRPREDRNKAGHFDGASHGFRLRSHRANADRRGFRLRSPRDRDHCVVPGRGALRRLMARPSRRHARGTICARRTERRPRTGRKERDLSIESVHQDINRAGFRGAAAPKHRIGAFRRHATQVRGDPDVGAEARRGQREPEAFAAALSSLTRCGVTSVDIGKPCAFSKSRSAAAVSAPGAADLDRISQFDESDLRCSDQPQRISRQSE